MSREKQDYYAQRLLEEWNSYSYLAIGSPSFNKELSRFVKNGVGVQRLSENQLTELQGAFSGYFLGYSGGSLEDYMQFRLPHDVPFEWKTNSYGDIDRFLTNGPFFASQEMQDRWEAGYDSKAKNYESQSKSNIFVFYLDFYSGGNYFRDYWRSVCLEKSVLIVTNYSGFPKPLWEQSFFPFQKYKGFSADATFPNLGYASQKRNSYFRFVDSIESSQSAGETVIVADCFAFIRTSDERNIVPVLVRFFWSEKNKKWLPDDLVLGNLRYMHSRFPIF